jgi:hypothetical protein
MADPPIALVEVKPGVGSLTVEIASPAFPQTLAGVLWRYAPDETPEGKAGVFTPPITAVPIGAISANRDKFYLIEGAVLSHGDKTPTPYQVLVSLTRDGHALHTEVPSEGGTGQIADSDVPFVYRFQLKEVA